MNLRQLLELVAPKLDINELAKDLDAPEDLLQFGQYVVMDQQAQAAASWKEAEGYEVALLRSIEKLRDQNPLMLAFEPVVYLTLAKTLRKQGRNMEALSICARVIGMPSNPEFVAMIQEARTELDKYAEEAGILGEMIKVYLGEGLEVNVTAAYTVFVDCGLSIQEIAYRQLEEVVEDGIRYTNDIGQPDWACGLRLSRAQIWSEYGRPEDALKEAQAALASRKREPVYRGANVSTILNDIADYQLDLERYDEAIASAQAAIDAEAATVVSKRRAYHILSLAYAELGDLQKAHEFIDKALALEPRSSFATARAYATLTYVYLKQESIKDASSSAACAWNYVRHDKPTLPIIVMLRCAQVRLAQVRIALKLPFIGSMPNSLEGHLDPSGRQVAIRRIKSALEWIRRAQIVVDAHFVSRGGGFPSVPRIEKLKAEIDALTSLIS